MRIVVAVGGSALPGVGLGERAESDRRLARLGSLLARVAAGHELVVVHGGSPQLEWLSLQMLPEHEASALPLELLDHHLADQVWRALERELARHLAPGRATVHVSTTVEVEPKDPALDCPEARVGPVVGPAEARRLALAHGWSFAGSGPSWRRVVPSPVPQGIAPLEPFHQLLALGHVVVSSAAGGVHVPAGPHRAERVDAVVDPDAASALLARQLDADLLVLATDVDGVYAHWATPRGRLLTALGQRSDAHAHATGSMRPKLRAAQQFARSGRPAVIGSIDDLPALVAGSAGTLVTPSSIAGIVDDARGDAVVEPGRMRRLPR